jgi:hypothetical protein
MINHRSNPLQGDILEMSLYSFQKKRISRGKGYSAVEAATYRAGVSLECRYYGVPHDYTKKSDVLYNEIMLPPDSPLNLYDREILWNKVEEINTRANSQLAHELVVALQVEFTLAKCIELVREFICDNIISRGLGADFAIHETIKELSDGSEVRNPHAHILIPTRIIDENGLGAIDRGFNDYATLKSLRKEWKINQSNELERMGLKPISHECYPVQDVNSVIKRVPKLRLSKAEIILNRDKGIQSARVIENNEIEQRRIEKELENQLECSLIMSKGLEL